MNALQSRTRAFQAKKDTGECFSTKLKSTWKNSGTFEEKKFTRKKSLTSILHQAIQLLWKKVASTCKPTQSNNNIISLKHPPCLNLHIPHVKVFNLKSPFHPSGITSLVS